MAKEQWIRAGDPALQYMGRIDWEDPQAPVWIYACTCVKVRFFGTLIRADITNHRGCWDNYMGVIIDGIQTKVKLAESGRDTYTLAQDLPEGWHELLLFKRQDGCHIIRFHGLWTDGPVAPAEPFPRRKIEVYGDSVSAGEVSEALDFCGQVDPPHNGELSNGYHSYSWHTARLLKAQLHDIAQGGVALLPETGYFHAPDYQGMEFVYDKIQYNDQILPCKTWDFSRYTPHVVVVAIGQNDNHPDDYMTRDPQGPQVRHWMDHYRAFVSKLREIYPRAVIILSTTILGHHPGWDQAIDTVCRELKDPKILHFLYSNNGCGTPGHIRAPEAEQMARELAAYIEAIDGVWED